MACVTTSPYENPDLAGAYEDGNKMPEESLRAWVELIGGFSPRLPADVVEIGSGTGMLCEALVRYGRAARVLGVEPSAEMRPRAKALHSNPLVEYVEGSAESVPARDGDFDLALLSRVVHHLPDRPACARELARVLRSDGVVVIRTTFRERLDADVYSYWPQALEADLRRFPRRDEVVADFATAGFRVRAETSLSLPVAQSLGEYRDRLATRPQSKLAQLSDEEFQAGLRRLTVAAEAAEASDAAGSEGSAVSERYDVLVLAKTGDACP